MLSSGVLLSVFNKGVKNSGQGWVWIYIFVRKPKTQQAQRSFQLLQKADWSSEPLGCGMLWRLDVPTKCCIDMATARLL